jgi:hypothetical protein
MARQAVVVEYTWKAYSPPDWWDALQVTECRVTYADGGIHPEGTLGEIRDVLEDAGFERQEPIQPTKTHRAGRWDLTWREVWARDQVETTRCPHTEIPPGNKSPIRGNLCQLRILAHAGWDGRQGDRPTPPRWRSWLPTPFRRSLVEALPEFRFNSLRDWWEAPLSELAAAREALATGVHLSDGAQTYLEGVA